MNKTLQSIRLTRIALLEYVADLDLTALNKIPDGFSNNIIWHLGHLVAAQESLCYRRTGQTQLMDIPFWEAYRPGSRPQADVSTQEADRIKTLLLTSLDKLDQHLTSTLPNVSYEVFPTPYGVVIRSIDEAVEFLPYHEGMHAGMIRMLKRLVK